jgi:protein-S-isoprenylcysteine O-methyltransferase Ste14
MTDATSDFILVCWGAWATYWVVMAFATKQTVERGGFIGYRLVALAMVGLLFGAGALLHVSAHAYLWHPGLPLGVACDCLVAGGVAILVWARITLGGNWSAEVTFKQDHELVESGPYALARHPIYTGLIVMGIATAVNYGRAIGFVLLVALSAGLWFKSLQEEQIMSRHFPDAYAEYKARVRALIPFVL